MTRNTSAVREFLKERLSCEIEAEQPGSETDPRFEPRGGKGGALILEHQLAGEAEEPELLERLRRDGIDDLLRRGERVKVSRAATEILPGR